MVDFMQSKLHGFIHCCSQGKESGTDAYGYGLKVSNKIVKNCTFLLELPPKAPWAQSAAVLHTPLCFRDIAASFQCLSLETRDEHPTSYGQRPGIFVNNFQCPGHPEHSHPRIAFTWRLRSLA